MSLRERRRAETLDAIRRAAAKLFAERGYAETRTRDIAREAGIATGTLFNYAPTKEAVVLLLWKDRARRAAEEGLLSARTVSDPIDAIDAVFTPIFRFYDEDRELGRVFLQLAAFTGPDDDALTALNAGFVVRIAGLFDHGHLALPRATNLFAAYYLVVTGLLNGTIDGVPAARATLRMLVESQVAGWQDQATVE